MPENKQQLTEDEKLWLRRSQRREYLEQGYVISWHLRIDFGGTTASINYQLNKLVKKGYLRKQAAKTHTKYYFLK